MRWPRNRWVFFVTAVTAVVVIFGLYVVWTNNKKDHSREAFEPTTIEPVREFLRRDHDGFVATFSPADLRARGARSQDEYNTRAARAVRAPTSQESDRLRAAVSVLDINDINDTLGDLWNKVTVAVVTDDGYEGGMPHTRGRTVFLPEAALTTRAADALPGLLLHELTHVSQREDPVRARAWAARNGYTPCHMTGKHPLERANPDLDGVAWCTQAAFGAVGAVGEEKETRVAFLYSSHTPNGLRDGRVVGAEYEHPNEAEAYTVAIPSTTPLLNTT